VITPRHGPASASATTPTKRPPALALVGPSNSGKTELICRLLTTLRGQGMKVAAVKHSQRRLPIDQPGKDTWRFHRAGAQVVALAAPGMLQVTQSLEADPELASASPADLQDYPQVIAYISDHPLPTGRPVFSRNQVAEIAAFILKQKQI